MNTNTMFFNIIVAGILATSVHTTDVSTLQQKKAIRSYAVWALQNNSVAVQPSPTFFQLVANIQEVLYSGLSSLYSLGYFNLAEFITINGSGEFGCSFDLSKLCVVYVSYFNIAGNGTVIEAEDGDFVRF